MTPIGFERLPFQESINWFLARVPMRKSEWAQLQEGARRKAFTVANVAQLDIIADVGKAIDQALQTGETLDDFKRRVTAKLTEAWNVPNAPRIETIFRTNVQLAYGAGRFRQLTDPAVAKRRPFWKFSAVLDGRTSRICQPLDGQVVAADSEFWSQHVPPLHFNCRSTVVPLTKDQATAAGIADQAPQGGPPPLEGFGQPPDASEWKPEPTKYPAALWKLFERKTQKAAEPEKPHGPQPKGTPVSKALTVGGGRAKAAIEEAIQEIDKVHGDGALPAIPIRQVGGGGNTLGKYRYRRDNQPIAIHLASLGRHPAMTTAHEIGHFLDHKAIGGGNGFETLNRSSELLAEWRQAVERSKALEGLNKIRWASSIEVEPGRRTGVDRGFVRYLLKPEEIFARSYAQYIATRSQNPRMLSELREAQKTAPWYNVQWADDDFEPIAKAFDRLLEKLGWRTGS